MAKTKPAIAEDSMVAKIASGAAYGAMVAIPLVGWSIMEPISFATIGIPLIKTGLWASGTYAGYRFFKPQHPITATEEDTSSGTTISGLQGSGKTYLAYSIIRNEFAEKSRGFCWLSVKHGTEVLRYLPESSEDLCTFFDLTSDNPLGMNWMRCYLPYHHRDAENERIAIADQTAELFDRLHPQMSDNMRDLIENGTLALLEWSTKNGVEVTFWELYRLMREPVFKAKVLRAVELQPLRDALEEPNEKSLEAVERVLRKLLTNSTTVAAFCQRDGIDLKAILDNDRQLVVHSPEEIGPGLSPFICGVISSRIQMLTATRKSRKPFGVFCDEFQDYVGPQFNKGISKGREYRLAWYLINQSLNGQIPAAVVAAINQCATRIYFRQASHDSKHAADSLVKRWEPEEFQLLEKRHYLAVKQIHGKLQFEAGRSKEVPPPNYELAERIMARSASGPTRRQIMAEITTREVEEEV